MKYRGVILTINQNFLRYCWFLAVFSEVWTWQFSVLASLIFVATWQSPSKLDSALAAPKIQF